MFRPIACLCLLFAPVASLAQPGQAPETPRNPQTLSSRHLEVRPAASPIRVDGSLDEAAWQEALVFDLPYEWAPGDNTPPPVATEFLVTYDQDRLYAAWRAHDPDPSQIRAHLMDRDAIDTFVQDDHVVLMVDPFNDARRAFQFRINPLGVQADAVFSENEGVEDFSFDMIWASAGRITEEGYVVEIAIPFNQIRFPRSSTPQTWGFDVGRSYPRSVRHRIASWPRSRSNNCLLCQVDKVSGFTGLEPGRNLEVTPTLTAQRTDAAPVAGEDLVSGDEEVEPGVSARWGITPNVSLNAAVNPDFSQVEADAAQLQVNQRFALFFPEKRPFFLEGVDYFVTPVQAVFTRTVVDPEWGLKLTGKEGGHAFGVFVSEDERNRLTIPSNQRSDAVLIEDAVTSGVVRYRRDVGRGSTVGALLTGREGDGYHNRVAGLDVFSRLSATDTVRFQALRSDTLYPGATARLYDQSPDAFQGDALFADYRHSTRDWFWSLAYEDRDPGFRADSGFVPRVDIREARGTVRRLFWGEGDDWYTQISIGLDGRRTEDHSGRLTDEGFDLYANLSGPLQSILELSVELNTDFVDALDRQVLYEDMSRYEAFFSIQPSGIARFTLYTDYGDAVDFTNNQPADVFVLAPGVELKLGRHLNAKIDHQLERLDVAGGELYEANLTQLRLIYNFNVRSFVRGIFQYLDLQRNLELHDPVVRPFFRTDTETFFTQLLFSYKLNPQTVLFLGYSDNRLGQPEVSLSQTDRTFFFKVGYALAL